MLEGWILGLHLLSAHPGQAGMNNLNPGVYAVSPEGWTGGAYFNSYRRWSAYGGKTWTNGRFAFTLAGVTGYERAPLLPLVVGSVSLGGGFRLSSSLADKGAGFILHLSWEKEL